MIFRTSYLLGALACALFTLSAANISVPVQAETLKITGPNGEVKQSPKRQYGPTTSADTFWSIAQKLRPSENISVYQVMAALYDANPHAFSGNNYNTLERGMILLVPSEQVMAAIPERLAKERADRDDQRFAKAPPVRPLVRAPVTPSRTLQIVPDTKPEVIVAAKPMVDMVEKSLADDLKIKLEASEHKVLMLTEELGRAQDELMVKAGDTKALKMKLEELSLQVSSLEEDFYQLNEKNQALKVSYQQLIEDTTKVDEPVVEEAPSDFWRTLTDSTLMLVLMAALPLLLIFLILFLIMRRRSKKKMQAEVAEAAAIAAAASAASMADMLDDEELDVEDDEGTLAVHLDEDDAESLDDLLDLSSINLQPEAEMGSNAEMDMASEMFIAEESSQSVADDDEGTSLDDLWAEAMEEQDEELEPLKPDDDDLDSFFANLEEEPEATPVPEDATAENTDDDIDAVLSEFAADEPQSTDTAIDADDDIDAMLAEFNVGQDDNSSSEADVDTATADDDIDAMLAEFDIGKDDGASAESEPEMEPKASTEAEPEDDDIDAMLAAFDSKKQAGEEIDSDTEAAELEPAELEP
ncbi:FimV/HubP family polar landmark protein, partial [Shewanella sp.]